jgi:uncharacterized protein with PQ loop repeat
MFSTTAVFYIGFFANLFSLIYRIPQIYKIYKSKSGGDISDWMLITQNMSYVLWIIHKIELGDSMSLISCIMSLAQNLLIWRMKVYYNSLEKDKVK